MKAKQVCRSSKNMFGKYVCSVGVQLRAQFLPWQYHYHSFTINNHD